MKGTLSVGICLLFVVGATLGVLIPPSDPNIQYVGRVDTSNSTAYRFDWSGTQIFATIQQTTSIALVFYDTGFNTINYDLWIDGSFVSMLNVSLHTQTYVVAQNLAASQPHTFNIKRRVEADAGISVFAGFILDDSASIVPSPPRPNKRIEFIGDSITCGWGAIGFGPCAGLYGNEDNLATYAAIASEIVGADYFSISWSGQGLVRHYGCPNITCSDSIPSLYNRTIGEVAAPTWNYQSWVPQVVAINLGTNDYGTQPWPPLDVFVNGYIEFVKNQVVANYGNVTILASCFWGGVMCDSVQSAAGNLTALGYNTVFVSYAPLPPPSNGVGCSGHPNYVTHKNWGVHLGSVLQQTMGW